MLKIYKMLVILFDYKEKYVLFYQKSKHAMPLVQFENNAPFFRIASIFVAKDKRCIEDDKQNVK